MGGTIKEVKQAIKECLSEIYPRGLTDSGISLICFRGKTGADGQDLLDVGDHAKMDNALKELLTEGVVISNGEYKGRPVYHYKTDVSPPVVGHMSEIKFAIVECLRRIHPKDLVCVGIKLPCFKDGYGNTLKGADGMGLIQLGDGNYIQQALKELVAKGEIISREQERDGEQRTHYVAKEGSINRSSHLPPNLVIPEREDKHNEFKETFSVPVGGGKADDVKIEVAVSVAAFTNTEGGRLFIGVHDNGAISGLNPDLKQYKNPDKLELAIRNYLGSKLGRPMSDIKFGFSEENYLVIEVPKYKRGEWFYVGDDFYIRDGNQSLKLSSRKTAEWQKIH